MGLLLFLIGFGIVAWLLFRCWVDLRWAEEEVQRQQWLSRYDTQQEGFLVNWRNGWEEADEDHIQAVRPAQDAFRARK